MFETRRENTHAIPPAADAPIVIRDRGSCGPRFLRSTLNMLPQSGDLLKGAALPLVAIINPMALQDPGDDPVEVRESACVQLSKRGVTPEWVRPAAVHAHGCTCAPWVSISCACRLGVSCHDCSPLMRTGLPQPPCAGGGFWGHGPRALPGVQGVRQPIHALGGWRAHHAVLLLRRHHRGECVPCRTSGDMLPGCGDKAVIKQAACFAVSGSLQLKWQGGGSGL